MSMSNVNTDTDKTMYDTSGLDLLAAIAEGKQAQNNDMQIDELQLANERQVMLCDDVLVLPAGSLVRCQYGATSTLVIALRDAQGSVVFEPPIHIEDDDPPVLFQTYATCFGGMAYDIPEQASSDLWYQRDKIQVTGSLSEENVNKLYRMICHSDVSTRQEHFFSKCVFNRWKEEGDQFYLCDTFLKEMGGPLRQLAMPCILGTPHNICVLLRKFIGDRAYFDPITFSGTNVFVIVCAYDLRDWFKGLSKNGANALPKDAIDLIEQFIQKTPDPLTEGANIHVASVLAYSFALIRLFRQSLSLATADSRKEPITKTVHCFCCSTNNAIEVPVGLQIFPLPVVKSNPVKNEELDSMVPLSVDENNGRRLYREHNSDILVAATTDDVTVDAFAGGRRTLSVSIAGSAQAILGVSVALYIYLHAPGKRETSFRSVVDRIANMPPDAEELQKPCDNLTKRYTKLNGVFRGKENFKEQAEITIKFAKILNKLSYLPLPDMLVKACQFALSAADKFNNADPSASFNDENDIVFVLDNTNKDAKEQKLILDSVKQWGEKLQEVERVVQITEDPSVLLYAAIKQLGPLQRFFYGPLLPIAMVDNSDNSSEVRQVLESLNLRPCVAVNPAIGEELLQMVKAALHEYSIAITGGIELFIKVDSSSQTELPSAEEQVFQKFASVYNLQVPSFRYSAARRLLSLAYDTREEEGHKSDDESTAFSLVDQHK